MTDTFSGFFGGLPSDSTGFKEEELSQAEALIAAAAIVVPDPGTGDIDLRAATSEVTINGAIFQDSANIGSGTGNYETFLAIGDNDGNERGFNSDNAPPLDDSNNNLDHAKSETLLLSNIPIIVIDGVEYYEFRTDINEANSNPNGQISLDTFQIYTSSSNGIMTYADLTNPAIAALRYNMDEGGNRTLLLSEVSTGSGTDDYAVLVPVAKFAGSDPASTYLYLYVEMGFKGGAYEAQSGFEEWNTQKAGTLVGVKFEDLNGNGVRDGGEPGVQGVTIFIDADKDGVLDFGERSTVTDANGNYKFFGVALGTHQIDEVVPAGSTQTTGAFETVTIASTGQIVTVDPIGNFIPRPALNIVKDAVAGQVADVAGELINYTITVANTGNTTLTGVSVTDPYADAGIVRVADLVGDNDALLEVGETWAYTAAHTLLQSEIDSNGGGNGQLENTATADSNETGPDTDDALVPVARNPALNIVKDAVAGQVADVAGELINYTITVANTGNTTLTGVSVTDPYADAGIVRVADLVGDNDALLEVGETWAYTAAHTLLQSEIDSNGGGNGQLENTATADSNETGPDTDDALVPVARNPALNIVKDAVAGQVADVAGELINYTITVANTGNTTLTGVSVTDPYADAGIVRVADLVGDNDALLEVGETWAYTAAHTLLQSEIDSNGGGNGQLENTATADSNETGPDTDDALVPVEQRKTVDLVKYVSVNGTDFVDANYSLGSPPPYGPQNVNVNAPVNFRITVQNTGNVTLTNVVIRDIDTSPLGSSNTILFQNGLLTAAADALGASLLGDNGNGELDVGETWTIEYTTEFDPGQHLNTGYITTLQGAADEDNAAYFSLVNEGPGVRTPGFWSNLGANLWNGVLDPVGQVKVGPTFAKDDLLITGNTNGSKDSNGDGVITEADKGLLIGDFNMNGVTDAGEDTFFIGYNDAKQLINASQKTVSGDGVQMLGRDVVATWLNYLAGNDIGTDSGNSDHSPKHFISDAVDWMQTWGGKSGNGAANNLGDNVKTETFDIYDSGHATVKTNTAQWNTAQFRGPAAPFDEHSAAQMHNALDDYNNTGMIDATIYAHDPDDAAFASALAVAQSASYGSGASTMEDNGSLVVMI